MQEITFQSFRDSKMFPGSMPPDPSKIVIVFRAIMPHLQVTDSGGKQLNTSRKQYDADLERNQHSTTSILAADYTNQTSMKQNTKENHGSFRNKAHNFNHDSFRNIKIFSLFGSPFSEVFSSRLHEATYLPILLNCLRHVSFLVISLNVNFPFAANQTKKTEKPTAFCRVLMNSSHV